MNSAESIRWHLLAKNGEGARKLRGGTIKRELN